MLEMPDLQEKKNQIVADNAKSAQIMYDLESKILETLDAAEQVMELLESDNLIDILADSKTTGDEIAVRRAESEVTEKEIDVTRESFRPVAYRSSLLFFCIVDLNIIDPMYQYSLQWFQRLFANAVKDSQASEDTTERIAILNEAQTLSLYQNICRSLFERHKLLFSLLLCTKILFGDNKIDSDEWRFFLAGPSGEIEPMQNPTDWLDDLEWAQVHKQLHVMDQRLPAYAGILEYFINFHKKFKKIFDSPNAHEEPLPGEWNTKLNSLQKMLILKAIRGDKITLALQNYISEQIGKQYIEPPTFSLGACFRDSSNISPLIFVLSAGTDPVSSFLKLCQDNDMMNRYDTISLGQGQNKKAEVKLENGRTKGWWILLQNCHLCVSFLPRLEAIVEQLNEQNHQDYRIWMTSMPTAAFPVSILQTSVKMTMEPPSGLKSNLLQTIGNFDNQQLNDSAKPDAYKKLVFAFAFFHAIVQDRRKFGAIGWNIPYAFTFEDFDVCKRQLKIFCDLYETIPYQVLIILGAEVNYGGRVTDDKDVRLIRCILQRFVNEGTVDVGYKFSDSGLYKTIPSGSKEDYITYIQTLPLNPKPEAFGLHENAEIITNQNECRNILELVLSIQPRASSGGGKSRDDVISEIAASIKDKVPPIFDLDEIMIKYPTDYNESMNTVLAQECLKYNRLLNVMNQQLVNIQKAIVGEVVMSEELEKMGSSLFDN
jgi:dynein heavy chain